jgi:drug/metabolite transporter (DMT)-like permease
MKKKAREEIKKSGSEFLERAKKPIFLLGVTFWVGLLLFFALSSVVNFRTGNVVNTQEVLGVSGIYAFIFLFILLGALLFFVWKYMIKKKKLLKGRD